MTEQNAPERIWADLEVGTWFDGEPYSDGDVQYVRADLYDAAIAYSGELHNRLNFMTASLRRCIEIVSGEYDAEREKAKRWKRKYWAERKLGSERLKRAKKAERALRREPKEG